MLRTLFFIAIAHSFFACGESEKKTKSPTLYGAEFCECLMENNLDDKNCMHIIEKIKSEYGAENKEAEAEFKSAVKKCVRNKTKKRIE
ncbi:MAG: hypothetical protein R2799_02730 [Crocinitomicaceae bacterium]